MQLNAFGLIYINLYLSTKKRETGFGTIVRFLLVSEHKFQFVRKENGFYNARDYTNALQNKRTTTTTTNSLMKIEYICISISSISGS